MSGSRQTLSNDIDLQHYPAGWFLTNSNQVEYTKYILDAIKGTIPWGNHARTLLNFDKNS